jgi:mannose-6-phosphate isomerase-like protein (cupin superfamily)
MQVVTEPGSESGEFRRWVEHFRIPALSVGTYRIVAGGTDDQRPHAEDEIYVVQAGRARLVAGDESAAVGPGSVVFVPAGEVHRFVDVVEELAVLVVFVPAESGG